MVCDEKQVDMPENVEDEQLPDTPACAPSGENEDFGPPTSPGQVEAETAVEHEEPTSLQKGNSEDAPSADRPVDDWFAEFTNSLTTGEVTPEPHQPSKADGATTVRRRAIKRAGSYNREEFEQNLQTVGQRLSYARLALGLTQAAVASQVTYTPVSGKCKGIACPLSRNAYCMYESDKVEPSLTMIKSFAAALNVTPEWLAFGIVSTNPAPKRDEDGLVELKKYLAPTINRFKRKYRMHVLSEISHKPNIYHNHHGNVILFCRMHKHTRMLVR